MITILEIVLKGFTRSINFLIRVNRLLTLQTIFSPQYLNWGSIAFLEKMATQHGNGIVFNLD